MYTLLELYLAQLHPEMHSWAEARKRIQVPVTLEAVHTLMASIDNLTAEAESIRAAIDTLREEPESYAQLKQEITEYIYKPPTLDAPFVECYGSTNTETQWRVSQTFERNKTLWASSRRI